MLCRAVFRLDEYTKRGSEPESELQIYTWPDATLRELTELIKDVRKDACNRYVGFMHATFWGLPICVCEHIC